MPETPETGFDPARAERYAEGAVPALLARAAANLGEPGPDGALHPEPNARAARLALLSAAEILDTLAPQLDEDTLVPQRAALARLQALFRSRHPEFPLAMPKRPGGPRTLAQMVEDAWEEAPTAEAPPTPERPGAGLPARSSLL